MGDWTAGWYASKSYSDYGWAATPGSDGIFVGLSVLLRAAQGAPNEENAMPGLRCAVQRKVRSLQPRQGLYLRSHRLRQRGFQGCSETYEYLTAAAEAWLPSPLSRV
jgi:glucose/mannose transport system substrate-binding protein